MKNKTYIRLDGDDIGNKIELSLLNGNLDDAQRIHNIVQKSLEKLHRRISSEKSAEILMKGCDDILFSINKEDYRLEFLIDLKNEFYTDSNFTFSVGVGNSLNEALLNLRKAKLQGKNIIIE